MLDGFLRETNGLEATWNPVAFSFVFYQTRDVFVLKSFARWRHHDVCISDK